MTEATEHTHACVCVCVCACSVHIYIPFSRGSLWPRDWTQGLPHCRQTLYYLSHEGSHIIFSERPAERTNCIQENTHQIGKIALHPPFILTGRFLCHNKEIEAVFPICKTVPCWSDGIKSVTSSRHSTNRPVLLSPQLWEGAYQIQCRWQSLCKWGNSIKVIGASLRR